MQSAKALFIFHASGICNILRHRNIALSIYGIIFCGISHLDSYKAELGEIVIHMTLIYSHAHAGLVEYLELGPGRLYEDLYSYSKIGAHFKTEFAYERFPATPKSDVMLMVGAEWFPKFKPYKSQVVPSISAIMPVMQIVEKMAMHQNYWDMVKLSSAGDNGCPELLYTMLIHRHAPKDIKPIGGLTT